MNKQFIVIKLCLLLLFVASCTSNEDSVTLPDFVVAFENKDASFSATDDSKTVNIVFSTPATENGTILINYTETGVLYNQDYITNPISNANTISVNYINGDLGTSFLVNKLKDAIEGETKVINYTINNVSTADAIIQGNTTFDLSFTPTASLGAVISPEIGGPNEPNQVYVDLSSQSQTVVTRDSWDLGFYNGEEFTVKLNGAIYMGASAVEATNINEVTADFITEELTAQMTTGSASNINYFDDATGDITKTAIGIVADNNDDNKVFLLKLGFEISDTLPNAGSVNISGEERGWKKIRIIKNGETYVLQYANINDTTYTEVTIDKDTDYNFTFFSFNTESTVNVEPLKEAWDLNFTVFTNVADFGTGPLAYGFSDFVVTNTLGQATSYEVLTDANEDGVIDITYNDFNESNIDNSLFSTADQRAIGSNWRNVFSRTVNDDRFYIVKDEEGNIYKIRFNTLLNESGERGHTSFDYIKIN